eukprot:NODE_22082_length_248_cov_1.366834_g20913_i0.p1 GENE.NODE_22082_length_248_cov_1.366834_g20913_i0~~NODE_22082_length_248_cov_1.366834_g20913_i0.p1  ORF type:complete len:60 (-),score=1.02 NODE_22082_length_248_cov_1.366834_g20913_i0:7-186(-)
MGYYGAFSKRRVLARDSFFWARASSRNQKISFANFLKNRKIKILRFSQKSKLFLRFFGW